MPKLSRASTTGRSEKSSWLSIDEACRLIGVDQSTLRRWSDAGKIPVFRTPGGHRRYVEEDVRGFVDGGARPPERPRVSRQELTNRTLSGYEEAFWRGARERSWFAAYTGSEHEEFRQTGRRLVDLAVRYAAVPGTTDRSAILTEGHEIGEHYGRFGARAGMTATETVEAFLYFRLPVTRSVAALIEEQGVPTKRSARLFAEIGQFLDQVLIATMRAHEAAQASAREAGADAPTVSHVPSEP